MWEIWLWVTFSDPYSTFLGHTHAPWVGGRGAHTSPASSWMPTYTTHEYIRAMQSTWLHNHSALCQDTSSCSLFLSSGWSTRVCSQKSTERERRQVPPLWVNVPLGTLLPRLALPGHVVSPLPWEGRESLSSFHRGSDNLLTRAPRAPSSHLLPLWTGSCYAGQHSPPVGQLRGGSRAPLPAAFPLERAILRVGLEKSGGWQRS